MIGTVRFRGAAHLARLGCAWLSAMLVLQVAPPVFAAEVTAPMSAQATTTAPMSAQATTTAPTTSEAPAQVQAHAAAPAQAQAQPQYPALATADAPTGAELHAIDQAAAGAVLAEVALRCHWQTDEAIIAKAKGMALLIAVSDVAPSSRQLALMVRILESARMAQHRDVAAHQVAAGACASTQSRALWVDLQNLALANAGASAVPPAAPPTPPASHP